MKSVLERLTPVPDVVDPGRPLYLESDIRAIAQTVVNLLPYHPPSALEPYRSRPPRGLLAVIEEDILVQFAAFEFHSGPASDAHGTIVEPTRWSIVFRGSGPSGSLRELRHTTWGEDDNPGYLHSPSAKLIADAFQQLRRWFDIG